MLTNLKSINSIIATSITASIIILANSVVSEPTGLQNSASLPFFALADWVEDANATTPPDYGYLYPDRNPAFCYDNYFCDTPPCGESLDETGLIASTLSCNMTGPIQNVLNKIYGNNSYVAIEAYADSSCSDLLSVPRWNGAVARFYRAEGCYKFDPVRSFQFYPYSSSIGSVKAVYYMNPTCSGSSAIPIYGNQDAAFVPKEQVSSTGCFNATVFLKPYNITAETGVLYPFARFYTSYSVGGNKYGQTPVSAQTATTTTKASSNGNSNSPSSARSLIAPPSIFLVFAAVFALLSL